NWVVRHVKRMVRPWDILGAVRFNAMLEEGGSLALDRVAVGHEDVAFLQYTGGTTRLSKGAVLSHGNILANLEQSVAGIKPCVAEGEAQVIITALPLYHILSLTANCLLMMKAGGCNILITNPRDIHGFVKDLRAQKFTMITGVNTLFNALMNHP